MGTALNLLDSVHQRAARVCTMQLSPVQFCSDRLPRECQRGAHSRRFLRLTGFLRREGTATLPRETCAVARQWPCAKTNGGDLGRKRQMRHASVPKGPPSALQPERVAHPLKLHLKGTVAERCVLWRMSTPDSCALYLTCFPHPAGTDCAVPACQQQVPQDPILSVEI